MYQFAMLSYWYQHLFQEWPKYYMFDNYPYMEQMGYIW